MPSTLPHADIGDYYVEILVFQSFQGQVRIDKDLDMVALFFQGRLQTLPDDRLIIQNQNVIIVFHSLIPALGQAYGRVNQATLASHLIVVFLLDHQQCFLLFSFYSYTP